jgi:hypothetical protein
MGHPPRIPVWLRWEQRVIYFVTICVANREPVLANERDFSAFKAAVTKLQHWTVLAAVLMPDHLHVIASPTDARDAKLGNFSAALKRWIRRELNAAWNWQPGCLTGCSGRMNRFMRSGSILRIIQCVLDSLNTRPIGRIELGWTSNSSAAASADETVRNWQATRLPYNDYGHRRRLRQSQTAATDEQRKCRRRFSSPRRSITRTRHRMSVTLTKRCLPM